MMDCDSSYFMAIVQKKYSSGKSISQHFWLIAKDEAQARAALIEKEQREEGQGMVWSCSSDFCAAETQFETIMCDFPMYKRMPVTVRIKTAAFAIGPFCERTDPFAVSTKLFMQMVESFYECKFEVVQAVDLVS